MKKLIITIIVVVVAILTVRWLIRRWRKADPKVDAALTSRSRKTKITTTKVYRGFRNWLCDKVA